MSCVLRITCDQLYERLPPLAMKSFRFDRGTAHFAVSACEFNDLLGQVRDAFKFLQLNRSEILSLMESEGAEGVLDFAIDSGEGFRFKTLPRQLVREAGALGLALEISLYPQAGTSHGLPNCAKAELEVKSIELDVLGMVANDYEASNTITADLSRDLGRPIAESEVTEALLSLASKGWVQAYQYDDDNKQFQALANSAKIGPAIWFKMTPKGQSEYENAGRG